MHLRRCQTFRRAASHPWETVLPREMSAEERGAVLNVCDAAVAARAGRTSAMMALRGSRAEKVRRLGLTECRGHGYLAGMSEEEVLARIDTLIHEGILRVEWREGLPLLGYSEEGLALAEAAGADEWTGELQEAVRRGVSDPAEFWFLRDRETRNHHTALLLTEKVAQVAAPDWLPLLRRWREGETRRMRGRLNPIIERLEAARVES
jgi:superfamily II DNA helicase RecQ